MTTTLHMERHFIYLNTTLWVSVGVIMLALFLFGFFKGRFTGIIPSIAARRPCWSVDWQPGLHLDWRVSLNR